MKKFLLALVSITLLNLLSNAQNVNIPDANFKGALTSNVLVNTNGDGEISVAEAAAYTGSLDVGNMGISSLTGIEAFTGITSLYVYQNLLTGVDISANVALTEFDCENNMLTSLDITANTALVNLYCSNNALTGLNLRNGNNVNFVTFYAMGNPDLLCIAVDSVGWATSNWTVANGNIDSTASFSLDCGPFVTIPDSSFRVNLLANAAINTINDGKISVTEASAFSGTLNVSNKGIYDLTGIEAFTALTNLNCSNNSLTKLDISANTALNYLYCVYNNLDSLDVSANTALSLLNCSRNSISELDVSANTALSTLTCAFNPLGSLDVSNNVALSSLSCSNNSLTSLDVSQNTALTGLNCTDNFLTGLNLSANVALKSVNCRNNLLVGLDVSNNTALITLNCDNNSIPNLEVSADTALLSLQCVNNNLDSLNVSTLKNLAILHCSRNRITTLDLSNKPNLEFLECAANLLTSIDVSEHTNLTILNCDSNSLSVLNVRNGNNINFSTFSAKGNPNLLCIEVDSVAWATTNWTVANGNIDSTASFSLDCSSTVGIAEQDQSFVVFPNPATGSLTIEQQLTILSRLQEIQLINAQGQLVLSDVLDRQTTTLDISALSKGIYFLRMSEGDKVVNRKIVIE